MIMRLLSDLEMLVMMITPKSHARHKEVGGWRGGQKEAATKD